MNETRIEQLLRSLGCDKIRSNIKVVKCSCPFAAWRHSSGRDRNPSFWVTINDTGKSRFGCWSCSEKGFMDQLVERVSSYTGDDLQDLIRFVRDNDVQASDIARKLKDRSGPWTPPGSGNKKRMAPVAGGVDYSDPEKVTLMHDPLKDRDKWHAEKMHACLSDEAIEYLSGPDRRLTMDTINRWQIGWHPMERRVCIPQYDFAGRLVNICGRFLESNLFVHDPIGGKWMHADGFPREVYLFGEDKINRNIDVCFLVEGQFDVIYLDQCGIPNALGVTGSHLNDIQADKIKKWFNRAVLVMDGDVAGSNAAEAIRNKIGGSMPVLEFKIGDGRDPNEISDEELRDLRDRFLV